jgi:alpha-galactosidase/6-phospho-beta-glucosidase family protein
MSRRIVIVGGGSAGWGPKLMSDLMLTPALSGSTYVLHDFNATNANRIANFSRKLAAKLGACADIVVEGDPEQALTGADFIIITISTGGLSAMAHDLAIPEDYSIYHTVGDTMGPGGWARTMRNVPVFVQMAERINRLAPNAVVLNYTNPMAQLTKTLAISTSRPVVGLCHGLFEGLEALQRLFNLESEDDIVATYGGVNHFFFITQLAIKGQDGYAMLREKLAGGSLMDLVPQEYREHVHWWAVDEILKATGMLTYMADRHIVEFLPQYLTSKENLERYHIHRTTIQERQDNMRRAEQHIEEMTSGTIPDHYLERSRETAADIIGAFATGKQFVDVGNTINTGQISNVPLGAVVETPVLVNATGFHAVTIGGLPEPARTWVERVIRVEDMQVQAAMAGDLELAFEALMLDPLCSHLNLDQIREMGLRLLRANQQYLPQFAGKL